MMLSSTHISPPAPGYPTAHPDEVTRSPLSTQLKASKVTSASSPLESVHVLPAAPGGSGERYYLRYAVGGNLLDLHPPTLGVGKRRGGGVRGKVKGFSRQAQKRLLDLANSINRDVVPPNSVFWITLDCPTSWPSCPAKWKRNLDRLRKAWVRRWGRWPVIWKREPQQRGAPHWHLTAFSDPRAAAQASAFEEWLRKTWHRIWGSNDPNHYKHGVHFLVCRTWDWVDQKLRYSGKKSEPFTDPETGEILSVGRMWGIWHPDQLPVHLEVVEVSIRTFMRVRRTSYRYRREKTPGPVRRRVFYISARATVRLVGLFQPTLLIIPDTSPVPNSQMEPASTEVGEPAPEPRSRRARSIRSRKSAWNRRLAAKPIEEARPGAGINSVRRTSIGILRAWLRTHRTVAKKQLPGVEAWREHFCDQVSVPMPAAALKVRSVRVRGPP